MAIRSTWTPLVILVVMILCGCQSIYSVTGEQSGKEKRDVLRQNLEKVQLNQQQVSAELNDLLTQFKAMYDVEGEDLEKKLENAYQTLKDQDEDCQNRAEALRDRIQKVERIASDFFNAWEQEIESMNDPGLKAKNLERLNATKKRYVRMYEVMKNAESRIEPVLQVVDDYVLYLNYHLNVETINDLKGEVDLIELEAEFLMKELFASISEAETFLKNFN